MVVILACVDSFLLIVIVCLVELVIYLSCAFEVLCYSKVEICICYGKINHLCFVSKIGILVLKLYYLFTLLLLAWSTEMFGYKSLI